MRTAWVDRPGAGRVRRRVVLAVVLLATMAAAGCSRLLAVVEPVTVTDPVWARDGWVYFLREVSSDGAELWRQRPDEGSAELVLDESALEPGCGRGVFSFLYRAPEADVGVAAQCHGVRTELFTFSAGRGSLESAASMPFLGDVAFADGSGTGFAEVPKNCGIAIERVVDGKASEFDRPITVSGKTFPMSGSDRECGSVAWVRSPALSGDGLLYFLAAPDSLGKLPDRRSDALESYEWQLVVWDPKADSARSLTGLPGLADLAVAPDGRTVLVAVTSPEAKGGVWSVDAVTGKMSKLLDEAEAHHPSFSPDGREFVYAEGYHRLTFSSARAG
ncbi:TolB family protein [Micromonospora sp. L31]|uniref:TolB family protein n=1 Tax=Micromonospora sp. L31 TaxID=3452213 RepID=UPI003F8CACAD